MQQCWRTQPEDRPTFTEIHTELKKLVQGDLTESGHIENNSIIQPNPIDDDNLIISLES